MALRRQQEDEATEEREGARGKVRRNTHHAVKYEEGSSVSLPRSERRHLGSVDLTPASSGWNWYDKDRSVSFGNRAGALQFSASLEARDSPVHVLSYTERLITLNKAWALCSWDSIHSWPRLTPKSEEVGTQGPESWRRERQICRAVHSVGFLPGPSLLHGQKPAFHTCPFVGQRARHLGEWPVRAQVPTPTRAHQSGGQETWVHVPGGALSLSLVLSFSFFLVFFFFFFFFF